MNQDPKHWLIVCMYEVWTKYHCNECRLIITTEYYSICTVPYCTWNEQGKNGENGGNKNSLISQIGGYTLQNLKELNYIAYFSIFLQQRGSLREKESEDKYPISASHTTCFSNSCLPSIRIKSARKDVINWNLKLNKNFIWKPDMRVFSRR